MSVISMKQLLEAGVHFGHQTRRWNPKMAPYIFTERNGIYIIDLQKTSRMIDDAYAQVKEIAAEGGKVLFVGTKKQAQDAVKAEAERCGMFYVNSRWLGGMLTNFKTIRSRIDRMIALERMQEDGTFDVLPKQEVLNLQKELDKLRKNLDGIRNMTEMPDLIFQLNMPQEKIAELVNMQLTDNAHWEILKQTAEQGDSALETTYSAGSTPLYVMWPDDASVKVNAARIEMILHDGYDKTTVTTASAQQ